MQDKFKINKIATVIFSSVLLMAGYGSLTSWHLNAYAVEKTYSESDIATNEQNRQPKDDTIAVSLARLLATSDRKNGKDIYKKKCALCHTYGQGERNKNGPNLYGIVGRSTASIDDFVYSNNIKNIGGTWTLDALNAFLSAPRKFAPHTTMMSRGVQDKEDRDDLLLYLKSISPTSPGKTTE